jgi:hypothetical protein
MLPRSMEDEPTHEPRRRGRERVPGATGAFSSESAFSPSVGDFDPDGPVRGYYIDFRDKAPAPEWPPPGIAPVPERLHVVSAQWALGAHERFLSGEGDEWLAGAVAAGEHLLEIQGGDGGWVHHFAYPHTYRISPPWLSAMAQGEAASLLVRLHLATGEERFAEGARRALALTERRSEDGGTLSDIDGRPFLEEYPTEPVSHVLNGAIFAAWGVYDVGRGLGDEAATARFGELADALADTVDRFDTGFWSTYDLYPHPVPNVASGAYHLLHVNQLRALHRLHPRPELAAAADRFDGYRADTLKRRRALAMKVLFRLAVPRNKYLAHRLPWSR